MDNSVPSHTGFPYPRFIGTTRKYGYHLSSLLHSADSLLESMCCHLLLLLVLHTWHLHMKLSYNRLIDRAGDVDFHKTQF